MKVLNISKNISLGERIGLANTFASRFFGLMLKRTLSEGEGLIIKPCNSIHMFFMRLSIDVIFIDRNNTVVYLLEGIAPWKVSKVVWNSSFVIELPEGTINRTRTEIGDKIEII